MAGSEQRLSTANGENWVVQAPLQMDVDRLQLKVNQWFQAPNSL